MIKVTGLWEDTDKKGNNFLSGSMGGVRIVIFKNIYKSKDSEPDYNLYFDESLKKKEVPKAPSKFDDDDIPL